MVIIENAVKFITNFLLNLSHFTEASYWLLIETIILGGVLLIIFTLFYRFFKIWWMDSIIGDYLGKLTWMDVEIKVPRENIKSPKSMEQVFASIYGIYSFGLKPEEIVLEGKVEDWISAEIAASHNLIRFIFHFPVKDKNIVQSAIYGQYPDAEITETDDYTKVLPPDLPNGEYDVYGADMILGKKGISNALPMRTYTDFSGGATISRFRFDVEKIDPIAGLLEVMANLKEGEYIWYQILMRPFDSGSFKKMAADYIKKVMTKKTGDPKENKDLTSEEIEQIRAANAKASKLVFQAIPRFVYVARKDVMDKGKFYAVNSTFQIFTVGHLNFMRPSPVTFTKKPRFLFKDRTLLMKKKSIYRHFVNRKFDLRTPLEQLYTPYFKDRVLDPSLWSVEELATIYHFPVTDVGAPGVVKTEAVKAEPPANLPIES
ncbi:MAG: hypothetical protein M1586_00310 [Patescibacteria group bacterium]|nr:hypothetical protein [Patescibacteria group bacterium]MCL5261732.1 hypothetical protein [Patescibacteria group bacterium]